MKFNKNVKELSLQDFENYRLKNNNKKGIVVFYATWCGFCQMLVPEYNKLGDMKKINVYAIDIDKNQELKLYFDIQSYPTIKKINKNGIIGQKYEGNRKATDMLSFALNQNGGKKKLKQCKKKTLKNVQCKNKTYNKYCYKHL